jgi:gliding motility-associated-like protein
MISFMKKSLLKASIFLLFFSAFSSKAFDVDTLYVCKGDGINYNAVTKAGKAIAWLWNFQSGSDGSGASYASHTDSAPPTVFYNTVGVFITTIKTTFVGGADSNDQVFVRVVDHPVPPFYFPDDTGFCAGSGAQILLNTTSFPYLKYEWSTGATTRSISINTAGSYSVTLKIKPGNQQCDSITRTVNVTAYPLPSVNLGQDRTMCQNQLLTIDAGAGTGYTYLWSPNGEVTRTVSVKLPGIYKVTITTPKGCTAEDEIEMVDSCPHFVFVPNAVSPNEDRLNDLFVKVWNFTPKDYTMLILNRWGEILFETNDLNAGWDCKYNGELVSQDIYVYKITYFDNNKKWYEMRGTFFVVR